MEGKIASLIIYLPAIIVALTFHEFAHAWVADRLGDDTPYLQGRLTLNPIPHLDVIGFIMLLWAGFGWAKPVQVNPYRFQNLRVKEGMLLVSLAGPAMNLLLAIIGMAAIKVMGINPQDSAAVYQNAAAQLLLPLVLINLGLMIFNLIPIPPLDGSKILAGILPDSAGKYFHLLEQYGMIIMLLLFVTGIFSVILNPIRYSLYYLIYGIFF
ncbi:MAG: site-2 protease family protein [Syntrophomonadaceae bacterium]|nr:site-2 protease family protein [Syntrophomonadaceae bacterium]